METKRNKHKLGEVLERLEMESWQLELLVSGFAIFLVAASFEPILEYGRKVSVVHKGLTSQFDLLMVIPSGLLVSVFFIFVNLLLHLVFRGLWISAIGIRFLSGDIDFESLQLAKPFDRFFARRLQSFDRYIENLERISSVIFGFTFLLVFMVMSMVLLFLFIQSIVFIFNWIGPNIPEDILMGIFGLGGLIFLFCALLYFIDFLSLGYFKRKRWIAIWYYPIYRFFGWITLATVYRPLYYNLIDNKFGRRVVLALVPYMLIMLSLRSIQTNIYKYIPEEDISQHLLLDYYDDERKGTKRIETASIPSRYIERDFLELFIHNEPKNDNIIIAERFPELRAPKKEGIEWFFYKREVKKEDRSPPDSLLMAISSLYQIRIDDSLYHNLNYFFFETEKYGQQGLKTIIDIDHLQRGKHEINIDKWQFNRTNKDSFILANYSRFPFWKE